MSEFRHIGSIPQGNFANGLPFDRELYDRTYGKGNYEIKGMARCVKINEDAVQFEGMVTPVGHLMLCASTGYKVMVRNYPFDGKIVFGTDSEKEVRLAKKLIDPSVTHLDLPMPIMQEQYFCDSMIENAEVIGNIAFQRALYHEERITYPRNLSKADIKSQIKRYGETFFFSMLEGSEVKLTRSFYFTSERGLVLQKCSTTLSGKIAHEPRGDVNQEHVLSPIDKVFLPLGYDQTLAEMSLAQALQAGMYNHWIQVGQFIADQESLDEIVTAELVE